MRVSLRLQQLAGPELEELLRRRTDAASALLAGGVGWERLASALLSPQGLVFAVNSLNRFLRQVLEVAVISGGSLSATTAAEEGIESVWLEQARQELTRWGLALPGGEGAIELVPGVSHLIWDPGSLGPGAEFMLEAHRVDVLRPMAINMGLSGSALPSRKADIIGAILGRMADPVRVAALLEQAPGQARSSFDRIRKPGGHREAGWLPGYRGSDMWRWHPHRAEDGPWWLVGHGLALPREQGGSELVVPAEVELALRGRLFPDWEPSEPVVPTTALAEGKHPLELVAGLSSLLQELRASPAPTLQQGGLPKRIVKRLAASLRQEESLVNELAVLALETGLLVEVEVVPEQRTRSRRNPRVIQSRKAEIRVSELAGEWEASSESERWVDFGRRLLIGGWDPAAAPATHLEQSRILSLLLKLPAGQGGRAEDLARRLHWTYPAVFPNVDSAARQLLAAGTVLTWLGAGGGEPTIGLGGAGRLLAGSAELEQMELERAFPAAVDGCTVTGDHRVVVSGPPSSGLSQFLGAIAEVESVHPARVYRLSEASLRRALDGGMSHQEIVDRLRSYCTTGIPQNVAAMIDDVGGRHGRLRVGSAGVYVLADDAAEIEALVKGRALRPLAVQRVAPTVAVVDAKGVDQVLGLLRKAGLMPVPDGDLGRAEPLPASAPARRAGADLLPGAGSSGKAVGRGPGPGELVQRLRHRRAVDPGTVGDHEEEPAAAVVSRALRSRRPITVGYSGLDGRRVTVLLLTPFSVSGQTLQGYEYRMRQMLKLDLQRLVWAEQTDATLKVGGLNQSWLESRWDQDDEEGGEDEESEDDWELDSDFGILLMPPGRGD